MALTIMTDTVRMGKKGQLTVPKKMRQKGVLKENDLFVITQMSSGELVLRRSRSEDHVDSLLRVVDAMPKINFENAYAEVRRERLLR